jgi:hypothetical protein
MWTPEGCIFRVFFQVRSLVARLRLPARQFCEAFFNDLILQHCAFFKDYSDLLYFYRTHHELLAHHGLTFAMKCYASEI